MYDFFSDGSVFFVSDDIADYFEQCLSRIYKITIGSNHFQPKAKVN